MPIGQALQLWWDLTRHTMADDGTMPHKLLVFPDEGHGIRRPGNLRVWYATALAFLGHHLRGEPWRCPEPLG